MKIPVTIVTGQSEDASPTRLKRSHQPPATSHRKRKARTEATVFTEQLTDIALCFGVFGERIETASSD